MVDDNEQVHCALIFAKARVTPLKQITVPRLELTASLLSAKIGTMLKRELEYENVNEFYWTDSQVVLAYLANDAKRFHVYVANRVQQIKDLTNPEQWNFVQSKDNPADVVSRGMNAKDLLTHKEWFEGPTMLYKQNIENYIDDNAIQRSCASEDPELKRENVSLSIRVEDKFDIGRFQHISDWFRLKRAVALCLKYKETLREKCRARQEGKNLHFDKTPRDSVTIEDIEKAETEILRLAQENAFGSLKPKENIPTHSPLRRLDIVIDDNGIVRVGGRLSRSKYPDYEKHPIVVPKTGHVTSLIIRYHHEKCYHQGKGITLNTIRLHGFWIINASSLVANHIRTCVLCRKLRGKTQVQKMAELPKERCEPSAPFCHCAVDCFGPFCVKEGRKLLKRYGCLFTCLSSRAIHIEVIHSMSTDSFINALRRLMSIRGPIKLLRSDQGTNFIGAKNELEASINVVQSKEVQQFLLKHSVRFEFNPPHASHFGGVFERMIRSARNVLNVLLDQHGSQLSDEALSTFMYEAANIVNSRPLTVDTLNDPFLEPLTPNHLLMMRSDNVLYPPGEFVKEDIYLTKRWKRVQYLLDQFWSRWRAEYLQSIQKRSKWHQPKRNFQIDDIVIIKDDDMIRNEWKLGRITQIKVSKDGLVRSASIRVADPTLDKHGKRQNKVIELNRPIHKLVLILENETGASPPGNH